MNPLAYGLLGLVALAPASGYELMQKIRPLWPVQHSQIYPMLAKLEGEGLVTVNLVHQFDRPDKKVYSITAAGSAAFADWLAAQTPAPLNRDEFVLKAYCLSQLTPAQATALFAEQRARQEADLQEMGRRLALLIEEVGGEPDRQSPQFGRFLLLHRAIRRAQALLDWCDWAEAQVEPRE